jgi:nucleotidyltransferase substrate binding protein (TIGR01987 family)
MTSLIKEIVAIILKYAKPERIYLYGSQVTEEAVKGSDIDIAFDDKNFTALSLINDDIEKLSTLTKIDIKNIAFTEDRFCNRVKTTGKVIYSSSKKLRAEDGLYNFENALKKYTDTVIQKEEYYLKGFGDIYLDVLVKRFEFTFEMSWKAIKRYLDFAGMQCVNPRSCFKEAYTQGLIEEEDIWLDMIEQRNLSSHIYNEFEIAGIKEKADKYLNAFQALKEKIETRLQGY